MEKIRPLSDIEVSIYVCRLQGAIYENNKDKINEILDEIKERVKELKENGLWRKLNKKR